MWFPAAYLMQYVMQIVTPSETIQVLHQCSSVQIDVLKKLQPFSFIDVAIFKNVQVGDKLSVFSHWLVARAYVYQQYAPNYQRCVVD
jgi:hypothetical protein